MSKPGPYRPPPVVTNPKVHLGEASSSSKLTRKPFHPPLLAYSPSRFLQHGALHRSPPSHSQVWGLLFLNQGTSVSVTGFAALLIGCRIE